MTREPPEETDGIFPGSSAQGTGLLLVALVIVIFIAFALRVLS